MEYDAHEGLRSGVRTGSAREARRAHDERVARAIARARLHRRIMRWLIIGAGAAWIVTLLR